jgi:uncharacterized Zn finger protein
MNDVKEIKKQLSAMEKNTSLRQIAIHSGINYITLHNIKSGKSNRVTQGVTERFNAFKEKFDADPKAFPSLRGKATEAVTKQAPEKKQKQQAATVKPAAVKTTVAKKSSPKKATTKKKTATPAVKAKTVPTSPAALPEAQTMLLGQSLQKEIEVTEARLDFLKQLRKLENEYLRKIGR